MNVAQKQMMMGTAVILTNDSLTTVDAKTAHGLIRGTDRFEITAVIDRISAGKDAGEVLDGKHRNIPIYKDIEAYLEEKGLPPDYAIIGVALCGGGLDEQWQAIAMDMLNRGISVVSGMHMHLSDIAEFAQAARKNNAQIIDIRKSKPFEQLAYWSGRIFDMKIPRIAVLGTDCALGKRTTSRLIMETCVREGIEAQMIYTGQTGWLQGNPYGFILDATLNDFVCGEIEDAIVRCEQEANPDLIIIEGQSALRNPMGPCGAELILSGNVKGVVLQHAPFRTFVDGAESTGCLVPDLATELKLMELYGTRVIAVALNGQDGTREALIRYRRELENQIQIPVILPLEDGPTGMDRFIPIIRDFIRDHDSLPDSSPRRFGQGVGHA